LVNRQILTSARAERTEQKEFNEIVKRAVLWKRTSIMGAE
jgi:hypothetical protein